MPSTKPKILLTLEEDLFERIEDFRFENRFQSRAEAVRALILDGFRLRAMEKKEQKKKPKK